jgi:hypothetical protein
MQPFGGGDGFILPRLARLISPPPASCTPQQLGLRQQDRLRGQRSRLVFHPIVMDLDD